MKRNTGLRLITGASMILGLALILMLRELLTVYVVDVFLGVVLFFAVFEVMRATKAKDKGVKAHYVYAYLGAAFLMFFIGNVISDSFGFWMHVGSQIAILFIFIVYTFLMYYVDTAFIKQCKLKKLKLSTECWKVLLAYLKIIGYPAAFIYALFAINHFDGLAPASIRMGLFCLLLVFVISAATDTFAYAVGVTLKGPKLCPKISPKKTWSGAVGGLFGGVLGTLTLVLLVSTEKQFGIYFLDKGIDAWWGLVVFGFIGLIGSIAVQAGDIFASFIKRKHEIKDFGKILPGHGGVMDRVDGQIFCALFIFIVMSIICFLL
jgi:phosphatidate cytidylyltransferase